jgi:septal ring factor EnvC (AmiA/AmiB activator)
MRSPCRRRRLNFGDENMLTTMVAIAAFLIALVAVWFTESAAKGAEGRHRQFYESHFKGLMLAIKECKQNMARLGLRLQDIDRKLSESADEQERETKRVAVMENEIKTAQAALGEISEALAEQASDPRRSAR